jgi:hypothetical protein
LPSSEATVAPTDFPVSGLIDTTFVIHLVNPKADYHAHALRYFQVLQVKKQMWIC